MVELKNKTVEELRKMASRKKIEGRSKMNKSELIRALKKKSTTKKPTKRRKMRGGVLVNGVNYSPERFNFLVDLLRPSNNQQNPSVYISPALNLSVVSTIDELLERPHYLVTRIDARDFLQLRRNNVFILHSYFNPPRLSENGHMILTNGSFNVNENVFLIQDNEGNYRILDTNISRAMNYRGNPAGYQAKLEQLGLGSNQRLFPIIEPVPPAQE